MLDINRVINLHLARQAARKVRRDEHKTLRWMTETQFNDPNLYEFSFKTPKGMTVFANKDMQGKWKAQLVAGRDRKNTRKVGAKTFWKKVIQVATEGALPTQVNARYTYMDDPKKPTLEDAQSALTGLNTSAGRLRKHDLGPDYLSLEPSGRQRLDHYVGSFDFRDEDDPDYDPEGWNQEAWDEEYVDPLRSDVVKALDKKFGKGKFWVDIGTKGFVDVQLKRASQADALLEVATKVEQALEAKFGPGNYHVDIGEMARRVAATKTTRWTVYIFSDDYPSKTLFEKTFSARNEKDAEKKALVIVKPQLRKLDNVETWVVEPASKKAEGPEHKPGDVWRGKTKWRAIAIGGGEAQSFDSHKEAALYAKSMTSYCPVKKIVNQPDSAKAKEMWETGCMGQKPT